MRTISRRWTTLLHAAPLLVLLPMSASAFTAEQEVQWRAAFEAYEADPVGSAENVISLARGAKDLPPSALTVAGDAYLRTGNFGNARKMFRRALEHPESATGMGPWKAPIASHAELGLAMAAIGAGKMSEAHEWFAEAADSGGDLANIATLGQAQAALALGQTDEALAILAALSETEELDPSLDDTLQVVTGQALLAAGDFEAAAETFDALAQSESPANLDAAYGAAVARSRLDDSESPLGAFAAVLERCPEPSEDEAATAPRRVTAADRALEPMAVLQRWVRTYREAPFSNFASSLSPAFDLRGCELASQQVAFLEDGPPPAAKRMEAPADAGSTLPSEASSSGQTSRTSVDASVEPTAKPSSSAATSGDEGSRGWGTIAVIALLAVILLVFFLRPRGGPPSEPRDG